ncbi:hypothetical protein LNKW23_18520 [Paralimibaculum aggregatum]|uniref:Uncharacterized protein n=1 Tax=Paralimibaculum aggregatum TaxID=3036245 RepID=A0ABQ6LH60_9RHOB|nr:hypothetical protein [Limibaculum sp. NKW23]GMG82639.1 hypothetical protein LNKW23_18520 [Limibaculum sp. NKW23]
MQDTPDQTPDPDPAPAPAADPAPGDPRDPLDPHVLTGLDLPPERLRAVAAAFADIRAAIEELRALDLGETHPAVVFQPWRGPR